MAKYFGEWQKYFWLGKWVSGKIFGGEMVKKIGNGVAK